MLSSPALIILTILLMLLVVVQLIFVAKNRFLFGPFAISFILLSIIFLTKTFVQSTVIMPFLNLLIGFSVGVLLIVLIIAKRSVKVMQQKFTVLVDFQLVNFIFSWLFLIFAVLFTNQ